MLSVPPPLRASAYFARAYRRTWRASVASTFINPVLYLLAMGVGLGSFVNKGAHTASLGHLSYLQFVAPALAATAAATTATGESMYPVLGAIRWQRTYHAMLSTPLGVRDVVAGHLFWMAARVAMAVGSYLVVMAAFGAVLSWWAVAVLPVGILTGMAFAAPLAAFAVRQQSDNPFPLIFRLGLVPLFLFSGVFFPISQLPAGVRPIAYVTPLWHGVDLSRQLTLGHVNVLAAFGHVAFLSALCALGVGAAIRNYARRLLT
ncbi:MAG TPA: ABC transporter permease [Acidimicrobiales bacterium]|nr:ABC transporter permease [Acidimicrobiales bacterium]